MCPDANAETEETAEVGRRGRGLTEVDDAMPEEYTQDVDALLEELQTLRRSKEALEIAEFERRRAEEALQRSEDKYRRLIDGLRSLCFFFEWNAAGELTYVSPSVQSVLGHSPRDMLGPITGQLTDAPLNEDAAATLGSMLRSQDAESVELELRHADGGSRIIAVIDVSVRDEGGTIVQPEGLAVDVTEQRRAESAVEQVEQKLGRLTEALGDECLFFERDPDGHLTWVSASVDGLLGYEPEQIIEGFDDYLTDGPHNDSAREAWREALTGNGRAAYEVEIRDAEGGAHLFEVVENTRRDATGKVIALDGIARDVTEARQAQQDFDSQAEIDDRLDAVCRRLDVEPDGSAIEHAVDELGDLLGADRAVLASFDDDGNTFEARYAWVGKDAVAAKLADWRLPVSDGDRLIDELEIGELVPVARIDELSSRSVKARVFFDDAGIASVLLVPIVGSDGLRSLIALEALEDRGGWRDTEIRLARRAGHAIAAAEARREADAQLAETTEELERIRADVEKETEQRVAEVRRVLESERRSLETELADARARLEEEVESAKARTQKELATAREQAERELAQVEKDATRRADEARREADEKIRAIREETDQAREKAERLIEQAREDAAAEVTAAERNTEQRLAAQRDEAEREQRDAEAQLADLRRELEAELEAVRAELEDAQRLGEEEIARARRQVDEARVGAGEVGERLAAALRGPVRAIVTSCDAWLSDDGADVPKAGVQAIRSLASSAGVVMEDVLGTPVPESPADEPFALDAVLEDVRVLLCAEAAQSDIELVFDLVSGGVPTNLVGDAALLRRTLAGLGRRVLVAGESKVVTLGIATHGADDGSVCLRFSVDGDGPIPEKELDLLTYRAAARGLGGNLEIGEAAGVTSLQLTTSFAKDESGATMRPSLPYPLRRKRVLLVDDLERARGALQTALADLGLDVTAIGSGPSALSLLQEAASDEAPYDLLLIDWVMPGMDGLETTSRIQQLSGLPEPPTILMGTPAQAADVQRRATLAGLAGWIVKPVSTEALVDALTAALSQFDNASMQASAEASYDASSVTPFSQTPALRDAAPASELEPKTSWADDGPASPLDAESSTGQAAESEPAGDGLEIGDNEQARRLELVTPPGDRDADHLSAGSRFDEDRESSDDAADGRGDDEPAAVGVLDDELELPKDELEDDVTRPLDNELEDDFTGQHENELDDDLTRPVENELGLDAATRDEQDGRGVEADSHDDELEHAARSDDDEPRPEAESHDDELGFGAGWRAQDGHELDEPDEPDQDSPAESWTPPPIDVWGHGVDDQPDESPWGASRAEEPDRYEDELEDLEPSPAPAGNWRSDNGSDAVDDIGAEKPGSLNASDRVGTDEPLSLDAGGRFDAEPPGQLAAPPPRPSESSDFFSGSSHLPSATGASISELVDDPVDTEATAGEAVEHPLHELDGISVETGLSHVGGDEPRYRARLVRFHRDYGEATDRLDEALEDGHTEAARLLAHRVASDAREIAADAVHQAATKLELALDEEDSRKLPILRKRFRRCLDPLIESLSALDAADPSDAGTDGFSASSRAALRDTLERLVPALRSHRPRECRPLIREIERLRWPQELQDDLEQLRDQARKYRFRVAAETAEQMLAKLDSVSGLI